MKSEGKKELDLKKIEEAAFSAIDELFSEAPSETDPRILRLEESILGLDWELSDEDLNKLTKSIEELSRVYRDKLNNILLLMMAHITKFLTVSRELAPPDTLNILSKIAETFKEINTTVLSEAEKTKKVRKAYNLFIQLRGKIPTMQKTVQAAGAKPVITPEASAKKQSTPEVKPQAAPVIPQELTTTIETGFYTLKKLIQSLQDNLQERDERSINQIAELSARISVFLNQIGEMNNKLALIETFKSELDSLKEKITDLEKHLISAKETFSEISALKVESPSEISKESPPQSKETPSETKLKTEILKEPSPSETGSYVFVFSLEEKLIALPLDNIANIYPVSSKKAKNLLQKKSVLLKEFKSFWRKLSKNMRGELKNLKEEDLKNLEVPLLKLSWKQTEDVVYKSAVLLQYNGKYGILLLGRMISKIPYFSEIDTKINEKEIEAEIKTPKGRAYLINPIYLLTLSVEE